MVTDPAGQHWSPYIAMGNNIINRIDIDGERDWPRFFKARRNAKANENYNLTGNIIPEVQITTQNKTGWARFKNLMKTNCWIDWNVTSSFSDIKFTNTFETKNYFPNILGNTTITNFTQSKPSGNGMQHIDYVNKHVEYSTDLSFAVGSVDIGSKGVTTSIGIRNSVILGVTKDGITVGWSTKRNNKLHGTRCS